MKDKSIRQHMRHRNLMWGTMLVSAAVLFVGANVHLVSVAFSSQPACVAHAKPLDGRVAHVAARSSC